MERLTNRNKELPSLTGENQIWWAEVACKLAAYEDSGLTPEQVSTLQDMDNRARLAEHLRKEDIQRELDAYKASGLTPERAAKLGKAEQEGRVIELPFAMGQEVFMNAKIPCLSCPRFNEETCYMRSDEAEPCPTTPIEVCYAVGFWEDDIPTYATREEAEAAITIAKEKQS